MPERHVCVACGALVPLDQVEASRCPTCADRSRPRRNAQKQTRRSPAAEQRRRDSPAGRLRASPQWRRFRIAVLTRDDYRCHYCGGEADTVDHLTPLSRGGDPLDDGNAVAACRRCNARKGARTAEEFTAQTRKA